MYASALTLVALVATPAVPDVGAPPRLAIEAPPTLEAEARELRSTPPRALADLARRLGLADPGGPIRVRLVDESSPEAAETPDWISGWAYGALDTVVLLAEREPSYPDGSLEELLRHEVAHVLVYRAAAGLPVPRWFHEGVALELSRPWRLEDRSRLTLALLLNERVPIADLDRRFGAGRGETLRAYALSGALVREMVRSFGPEVLGAILYRVSLGLEFRQAFFRATGVELSGYENGFWRRYSLWYRWLPVLTSSVVLWMLIVLLALWAGAVRRRRRAALEKRWAEEESADFSVH